MANILARRRELEAGNDTNGDEESAANEDTKQEVATEPTQTTEPAQAAEAADAAEADADDSDTDAPNLLGGAKGLPPAWLTDPSQEAPAGTQNNGSFVVRVYTEEQQLRLGVDETGKPVHLEPPRLQAQSSVGGPQSLPEASGDDQAHHVQALPPAHLTGGIEAPLGEKNHGSFITAVYTEEQQVCGSRSSSACDANVVLVGVPVLTRCSCMCALTVITGTAGCR